MPLIPVRDFEKKVRELEGIPIAVHAPSSMMVEDYHYINRADSGDSIKDWLKRRVEPLLRDHDFDVINSDYFAKTPHGRTTLGNLRGKYVSKKSK